MNQESRTLFQKSQPTDRFIEAEFLDLKIINM